MSSKSTDILIIGGGIIGLTIARALSALPTRPTITLLEKDTALGTHSATKNSGVLHSGIYYPTGSLKAIHCIAGNKLLTKYSLENKLPILQCGKLIVAKNDKEFPKIGELYEKGKKNGATLMLVNEGEARGIDPHLAKGLKYPMIWSPNTSVASPRAVFDHLEKEVRSMGNVNIICGEGYSKLLECNKDSVSIKSSQGNVFSAKRFINCAGLYSDRIAHDFNEAHHYTLFPLKGLYMIDNTPYKEYGLKTLIYPVPPVQSSNFLGVHTTLTTDGKLKLGPTAVPCLWREHYKGMENFKMDEMMEVMGMYLRIGFSRKLPFYLKLLLNEAKKYYLPNIVKEGQQLIDVYDGFKGDPHRNFKEGKPAIRAQLVDKGDLTLVNDFQIVDRGSHIHLLNIVSPGWTSALSFAEDVKKRVQGEI